MLTPSQAACFIFNLAATPENGKMCLKRLQECGLEPVYYAHGNPYTAFALATSKINSEPWKYKRYTDIYTKNGTTLKYSFSYKMVRHNVSTARILHAAPFSKKRRVRRL